MRAQSVLRRATVAVAAVVLLAGCSHQRAADLADGSPSRAAAPSPKLGGDAAGQRPPPRHPMDSLEKPVADRLARQVARQGLTLTYLDCPHWDGAVPSRMICRGYVDGLVAKVRVLLRAAVAGRAVSFDARLGDGVIATRNLEGTLRRKGWSVADCGDVAAYPARVGSEIVCRVTRTGEKRYVVATVSGRAGAVMIADYRREKADR